MRLLLDTHAVMWMDATPERFSARVRDLLGEAEHDLFLSVVVVWELGIKHARGKLTLPEPIDEYVLSLVERARMSLLAIDTTHVLDAVTLPLHHGDPFDRMLIAQARIEKLTLVTADPVIARYAVDIVPA
jgi:PIN domain nuclease of toxin-antitoxin system